MVKLVQVLDPGVTALLQTAGTVAQQTGTAAYVVGGWVRDLLLARPNGDIDITVEGDGLAYAQALAEALQGDIKEVPRFGTAHIYIEHPEGPRRIDIATARKEIYESAGELPKVEPATVREDLGRRDFSINAMAIRLEPRGLGSLLDPFGGQADLRAGRIRILHSRSFEEDPTRILRAVRFAHRYGFILETQTLADARQAIAAGYLNRVSMERLRNELILLLSESGSGEAVRTLAELGLVDYLLPGVSVMEEIRDRLNQVDQVAEGLPELAVELEPWVTKLAILIQPLPLDQAVSVVERLKLPRQATTTIVQTVRDYESALRTLMDPQTNPAQVVQALSSWTPAGLLALAAAGVEAMVAHYWREWRHVGLAITGADLIAQGVPPGPAIRRALAKVLAEHLCGGAEDAKTQLSLALRYAREEA